MGLLDFFRSRENDFLKQLGEQAKKTCEGLEALEAYMKDGDEMQAKRLHALEKEADELRRILIDELNHTFVTPIDREDLYALSRTIDDVIDYGYSTLDEMVTLGVKPNMYCSEWSRFCVKPRKNCTWASSSSKTIRKSRSIMRDAPKRWKIARKACIARRSVICSKKPKQLKTSWTFSRCAKSIAIYPTQQIAVMKPPISSATWSSK